MLCVDSAASVTAGTLSCHRYSDVLRHEARGAHADYVLVRPAETRDSIATGVARFLVSRRGAYDGEEVRAVWHEAGIASYRSYLRAVRTVLALLTPEQMEKGKRLGQLGGFFNINSLTDKDLPFMFRGPMSGLP